MNDNKGVLKKFSGLQNEEESPRGSINNENQNNFGINEERKKESIINNEEQHNNDQSNDFNQNNEFPGEEEENKNNENIINDNLYENYENSNNNQNKFNATEKLDESNNNEENNIRFSSIKDDKININNENQVKSNEPMNKDNDSGFVYDDDYDNNNNNNDENYNFDNNEFYDPNKSGENDGTNQNLNIKNMKNNDDINFKDKNNGNNNYENDFEFVNNNNIESAQNYNIKRESQNNALRNRQNYNNNINNFNNHNNSNNNNTNYYSSPYSQYNNAQNGGYNKQSNNQNLNQTETHFIPQESPIVNSLNYPKNSQGPINHRDYDPYYEQFEELHEDGDGQSLDPNKKGKDSSKTAGTQISNTIMGAGILSIPIIMRYLGILLGTIFIIFLALSTIYSVYILIRCHEITGKNGYSMFGKITMGKFGSMLIKIIIIINNLGLCIAYFRIFGEVLQTIIQAWVSPESFWATNWHNYIYILMCGVIMIFFIFIKNISSLKKVAYLGVFAVLVFTISLSILLFYKSANNYLDSYAGWDFLLPNCTFYEAFHAIPTVFLAFLFQFNVFPIYLSLKHKSMETMMKATKIGVGYSLMNFLIVGIVGFLLYGLKMEETILNSFSEDMIEYRNTSTVIKVLIIIICISFVTTCLTSFPVLFFSLRENYVNSILFCIKNCCRKKAGKEEVKINERQYDKNKRYISERVLAIITIVLYFLTLALAIVMPKLKLIFTIVGATAGTFIAFILPNLFYIRICKISGKNYNIVFPLILFFIGVFFLIVSIIYKN